MTEPTMPVKSTGDGQRAMREFRIAEHAFRIAEISPQDQASVLKLFAQVFGHAADAHWYQWKYCQVPSKALGLWDESGELVAHYAGSPRTVVWQGRQIKALQIGDVMVTPRVRGLMTRKGPFFMICSLFFETWTGSIASHEYQLAFGFPNARHMQLGDRLDLYHHAGKLHLLRWAVTADRLSRWWRWSEFGADSPAFDREVNKVWAGMAAELKHCVVAERDAAYMRWRFLSRPDREYRLFSLRHWWGAPAAVVVMRFGAEGVQLLDVVGRRSVCRAAVQAALMETARMGAHEMTAWASPVAASVLSPEGRREDSGASVAIARASALLASEVITARCWWMGGDTDFL